VVSREEKLGVLYHLPSQPHHQGVREEGGREELVHNGTGQEGRNVTDGTIEGEGGREEGKGDVN